MTHALAQQIASVLHYLPPESCANVQHIAILKLDDNLAEVAAGFHDKKRALSSRGLGSGIVPSTII
jgi:hypothetical protein